MSEVTAWSATDNANTAAPPDGWPEGMQPSAVNDAARMMMGALRREHDRITAQIGSVAGTINTTNITAVTVNTTGAITASGPITGTAINSTGNGSIAGTLTTGNLNASGNVTAVQVGTTGNITAGGGIQGASLSSTGAADVTGLLNTGSLGVFGNAQVNGNINSNAQISADTFILPNNRAYYGRDTGGTPHALVHVGSDNKIYLAVGGGFAATNAQFGCGNHIYPLTDGVPYCGLAAFAWAGVVSYSFPAPSDRRQKTDIQDLPGDCTALVSAIAPKRFRWREGVNSLDPQRTHWGFIAQEIGETFSAANLDFGGRNVGDDDEHRETLDVNELVAVLWGAVREMAQQIETLKRERADV
jgi:hypothetical protein